MKSVLSRAAIGILGSAVAASGVIVAVSAAPATAAPAPIDITRVAANPGGAAISSRAKAISVRVNGRANRRFNTSLNVYGDVYRGKRLVKKNAHLARITPNGRIYNKRISFRTGWGRGAFRIGNVRTGENGTLYRDRSYAGGRFLVKSAVRGSGKIRYRYGSNRKVAVISLKRYNTNGRWGAYRTLVRLQFQKGGWRAVKKIRTNGNGVARHVFYKSGRHKYRFIVSPNATTVAAVYRTSGRV